MRHVARSCRQILETVGKQREHFANARHEITRLTARAVIYFSLCCKCLTVEATAGIEPACTDLQSAASPLRHVANPGKKGVGCPRLYRSESLATIARGTLRFSCHCSTRNRLPRCFQSRTRMTDFAAARRHMVDGQVRTADVTDLRIQAAMLEIPRENFVPPALAPLCLSRPRSPGWRGGIPPAAQTDGACQADPRRRCRAE